MGFERKRAFSFPIALLLAATGAACSAVLGLDPPTLDPCATTACVDGEGPPPTLDASGGPDTSGGMVDAAAPEAGLDSGADTGVADVVIDRGPSNGIRCGGGATEVFCSDPTPLCCLTTDDAGANAFACVASGGCGGYPISCATDNDCPGSDVCCFFKSGMKCDSQSSTGTGQPCEKVIVCDPTGSSSQCNTGQTCTQQLSDDAGLLPYYECK